MIFNLFSALFHSNSPNIDLIAIRTIGNDRAHKTAHFTYTAYCDMIRPKILNYREIYRNPRMKLQSRFNLAKNPRVDILFMKLPGASSPDWNAWRILNWTWALSWVRIRTEAR